MEYILEFVVTVLEALFDGIKKPEARRWALTILWSFVCMFVIGICLMGLVDALKSDNHLGTTVLGILTGLWLGFSAFFILRGHRRHWKKADF